MKKRLLALSLALVMALGLCVTTAWAEDINYLRWDDTAQELVLETLAAATNTIDNSTTDITWEAGWYVAKDNVTINGKVTANGDVNLLLMNGCTLTIEDGIVANNSLTICAQSLDKDVAGKLIVSSKDITQNGQAINYGIYVENKLTINGGIIEVKGGKATSTNTSGTENDKLAYCYGIYVENELTIRNSTVTCIGGASKSQSGFVGARSYGIYLYNNNAILISNSTVTVTGGNATSVGGAAVSYGISGNTLVISNSTVEANGGGADGRNQGSSNGIDLLTLTLNSGTVTGATGTVTGFVTKSKGIHTGTALNLPTAYQWYMEKDGTPIASSDTQLTKEMEGNYGYLKITSVITADNEDEEDVNTSPDTDPVPDTEPVSGGHTPVRRQNTTTATTEAAATDTTTDTTKTDTVTSAKTFDVGTAVYGVLAVASLLGMGYVGKKR